MLKSADLLYRPAVNLPDLGIALRALLGVDVEIVSVAPPGRVYVRQYKGVVAAAEAAWRAGDLDYYSVDRARRTVLLTFEPPAGASYEVSVDGGGWTQLGAFDSAESAAARAVDLIAGPSTPFEGVLRNDGTGDWRARARHVSMRPVVTP